MRLLLLAFHIVVTLILIGVILFQKGENVSSESIKSFVPRTGNSLLTRITAVTAFFFMADCVLIAILIRDEALIRAKNKPGPIQSASTPPISLPPANMVPQR